MKRIWNDPYLEILDVITGMPDNQLEILRQYAIKLKAAYAAKEKVSENGKETVDVSN